MNKLMLLLGILLLELGYTQEKVTESFAGIRVINNHSNECIPKQSLDFIVAHKFGDIAGVSGGSQNFYGFDNLADVRLGFAYGILNNLNIGLGRSKGVGARTQVVDAFAKYGLLSQKTEKVPLSLTYVSAIALPYAKASNNSASVTSYPKFVNRFIFTNQLLLTRKFGDRFTWQINLGYNHRNFVAYNDRNGLFFAGTSVRLRFTKTLGILAEFNHIFDRNPAIDAQDPLSFAFEIMTGGHVFALHVSNSQGLNENLFIPETTSNWLDGQWRIGFSFNRRFKL